MEVNEIRAMIDKQAEELERNGFHQQASQLDEIGLELELGPDKTQKIHEIVTAMADRGETRFASVIMQVERAIGPTKGGLRNFAKMMFERCVPPTYREAANVTPPRGLNKRLHLRKNMMVHDAEGNEAQVVQWDNEGIKVVSDGAEAIITWPDFESNWCLPYEQDYTKPRE